MLFASTTLAGLTLSNRIVMAPMTRARAEPGNVPGDLVATYYAQRASAGLLITEGTSPSANGCGYARVPAIYNAEQIAGWRKVADAVHAAGGKLFMQLMHVGRAGHTANQPAGAELLGATAIAAPGEMYTDAHGMQPYSAPRAMNLADLAQATREFAQAAKNAIAAGVDGVELHAANGYLLEQFLNANINTRNDEYGGSPAARNRLTLETARAVAAAVGASRVGVRISPHGSFNGTGAFKGVDEQYLGLAAELSELRLAYLHVVDHAAMGAPAVPEELKASLRKVFRGTYILSGGYDAERANADLRAAKGDLVAFGRPFLANPDLTYRLQYGAKIAEADMTTAYTPGALGYTDYPVFSV